MKKIFMAIFGFIFLALAIIGIFVPVLPTTPFLLLAAFFFLRGSERMHNWLINHRTFGPSINSYMNHRALRKSTKIKAISTLWISLGLSIYLVKNTYVDVMLIIIGLAVGFYLLSLKTMQEE